MQSLNLENPVQVIYESVYDLDENYDDYFDEEGHLKIKIPVTEEHDHINLMKNQIDLYFEDFDENLKLLKTYCQKLVEMNFPFVNHYVIMPEFSNPGGYEAVTKYKILSSGKKKPIR